MSGGLDFPLTLRRRLPVNRMKRKTVMRSLNTANIFPKNEELRREKVEGIVTSLRYLEREAIDAAFPELAMLIGVAALAAQEISKTPNASGNSR